MRSSLKRTIVQLQRGRDELKIHRKELTETAKDLEQGKEMGLSTKLKESK